MGQEIPYIVNREYHNNYEKGTIKIARLTKFPNRKGPESNLRKLNSLLCLQVLI